MKNILYAVIFFVSVSFTPGVKKLKPTEFHHVSFKEPSDVCISARGNSLFMVSGDRHLYETDMNGKTIRQSPYEGFDFEAVHCDADYIYVSDESFRQVLVFDYEKLNLVKTYQLNYNGPRNKGFESLTWNASKSCFVMMSEKNPCIMYELDKDFRLLNQFQSPEFTEISAVTYHNKYMWMLSDEEMTVYKTDPQTYKVIDKWEVPIVNPEGITFDKEGNLYISSDDMGRLYFFKTPGL